MVMQTADIPQLLRPGVKAIMGTYNMYKPQYKDLYSVHSSDKAAEYEVEMRMLGPAQIKAQGSPTATDNMGQRVVTTFNHKNIALSFAITEEAIEDNLYKTDFPMQILSLKNSMLQTEEILGASVFNNGASPLYPIGDGQPFFSLAHPIDGSTYSNRAANYGDFTEATFETAYSNISQFRDQAGLIVNIKVEKVATDTFGQWAVDRVIHSQFSPNNADNSINPISRRNAVPKGYTVNQYFTTANAWFVLTDCFGALKHYIRKPLKTDVYTDPSTRNVICWAGKRYSFGVSNARGAYAGRAA